MECVGCLVMVMVSEGRLIDKGRGGVGGWVEGRDFCVGVEQ